MADHSNSGNDVPLGQRLLEKPFLMLAVGMIVMLAFYTIWGAIELWVMPKGTLP